MDKDTKGLFINLASLVGGLFLIVLAVDYFTETDAHDTQTQASINEGGNAANRYFASKSRTTAHTHTQPKRINVPVKIKPKIPGKEFAVNSSEFLDSENQTFGTPMPIYKDNMIDMLRDEARENAPGALTSEQLKKLEREGNLIW